MPLSVWAASDAQVQKRAPIEVTSDRLELDDVSGTLVFIGSAVAVQGDITIHGDQLTVQYHRDEREIEQVVAEGHVRIVQESRTATGEKAVFFRDEGRVVLTGQPKVTEGENFVQGEEITIFLNDRRSIVTGGSGGRVNAVFSPSVESKP